MCKHIIYTVSMEYISIEDRHKHRLDIHRVVNSAPTFPPSLDQTLYPRHKKANLKNKDGPQ